MLSVFAMLSYPLIFVNWPLTRDFPWANILLCMVAGVLVFLGIRRAFVAGRGGLFSKIGSSVLAVLSIMVFGLFVMVAFISSTWMPSAAGAPQISQKAPDFALVDTGGNTVSLSDLLAKPIPAPAGSTSPKGVLLIFYRGYW